MIAPEDVLDTIAAVAARPLTDEERAYLARQTAAAFFTRPCLWRKIVSDKIAAARGEERG